jgi:hypothetical protein
MPDPHAAATALRRRHFFEDNPRPRKRYLVAVPLMLVLPAIPFALGIIAAGLAKSRRLGAEFTELDEEGVHLRTHPIMVNSAFIDGRADVAGALVFASFDHVFDDDDEVIDILAAMMEISSRPPGNPDEEAVHRLMNDQEYVRNRRRRIPPAITKDRLCYAFDLILHRDRLEDCEHPLLMFHCLATPGERGSIMHISPEAAHRDESAPGAQMPRRRR